MCTACLTTVETSELRDCLAELGIDVDSNLIERNLASNSVYAAINFQWQERGAYRHPKAYLLINSATDIQAAIKCGRSLNLEIVARNGGHGYIKSAYGHSNGDNTLILDLKAFKSIVVDQQARTATVDAGALLGHVAYELWENGNFVFPYGICGSVGISGYALGGGHTLLAYKLGLAIDNIIELEMVNANAELLTINNETNTNLFWALRGAGATGSFGIVTKLVLQLHPAPHQIINIDLEYNFEQFHDVYAAYQASVNASFNYRFTLSKGTIKASVSDIQSVTEAETIGAQRIQQAIDLLPAPISPPVQTLLTFTDFLTKLMYVTRSYSYIRPGLNISEPKDLRNIASYGTGSEWFKAKSLFVNKLLSQSEIMEFKELLGTISLPDLYISLETFSGKVNEFHPQMHSSFIHRDAYFDLYAYMVREKADAPVESAKLNEFFEKSKRILNHTTSYQNYADDEMSDALERYYGANLPRLIDIKTEVDPDNFFT
ncbi:uncharacterized FAD-linked oxidoreductase YgaK-like, partial [Bradysia coprophila]|uniref:uncharacterized FAD-linked oxidoreductase YgaK-like n=1 Tax=Bradysia coprophila TaxID=38358 RepID=UPI00187DD150